MMIPFAKMLSSDNPLKRRVLITGTALLALMGALSIDSAFRTGSPNDDFFGPFLFGVFVFQLIYNFMR
jgi:hypothetical protein